MLKHMIPTFSDREVYEAAMSERNLLLTLLAQIVLLLVFFSFLDYTNWISVVMVLLLLLTLVMVYFIFDLARKSKLPSPWAYAVAAVLLLLRPLTVILVLLVVTYQAHKRVFQPRRIPIGFLGPKLPKELVESVKRQGH